jgi:hypothetical protein
VGLRRTRSSAGLGSQGVGSPWRQEAHLVLPPFCQSHLGLHTHEQGPVVPTPVFGKSEGGSFRASNRKQSPPAWTLPNLGSKGIQGTLRLGCLWEMAAVLKLALNQRLTTGLF